MASNLRFNVTANDDASGTFAAVAAAAKALDRELAKLDRKITAKVDVTVPAAALAKVEALDTALDRIDGRTARANVQLSGASAADLASIEAASAALAGLNGKNANARVNIDVDRGAVDRLGQVATRIQQVQTVAAAAAVGVTKFRAAARMLVDPGTIPIIQRASEAIRNKFHSAVEIAAVGVGKLSSALKGLDVGMLGLAAVGKVSTVIAGVGGALADLSGIALLAPAALAGVGVAFATAKIAATGFADALTGSAKKQAEAFAAMGPEAQKLVTALKSLGPAANEFRRAVQDTAVEGFAAQVKQLASAYLPMLKSGLSEVATGLNAMALNAMKMAQATATLSAVRAIVDATASATSRMRDSVANAVAGFLTLAAAGASSLPGIGTAIDAATEKFRVWSMVVTQSGQFDAWVARAKTGFQNLGTTLGNLGSIASTVFRTLDQNGAGLLATLASATTSMRTFVESAQGSAALTALAQMAAAAGDALSNVLGVALRALSPILVSLAPVVSAVATAFGDHLVRVINLVSPALQRFAAELAKHPDLIADIAVKLHTAIAVFGPFVAVLGLAAAALQRLIIARVALAALTALGLAGTAAGAALMFLVSPLSALGQLMPTIAAALGRLGASLTILAGPIGWLIVGFATLYASSSQFRDGMNQIGGTLGGIFLTILKDAGSTIAATVSMIGTFVSTIGSALAGLNSAASSTMSIFGPFGQVVSSALTSIFGWLGKLPGVALAAFAAFVIFGKVAPIFALASAAVAGFAARMAAFTTTSAAAAIAANGLGLAAGRVATGLAAFAARLPAIGVALIALGAVVQATAIDFDGMAQKMAAGSMSFGQAVNQAFTEATTGFTGFMNWLEGDAVTHDSIVQEMSASWDKYRASLGPMEQLQADVGRATGELNDLLAQGKGGTAEAAAAADRLSAANGALSAAQRAAAEATKTHAQRIAELADAMNDQIGAMVNYEQAVLRTAEAQKAANEALAESGRNSAEYKKSVLDLVAAMSSQANAAREQGEAWGGAEGATRAYNTELLRAADLSTTAGRDAFAKLASSLGNAELAALSATAAQSQLRTEIMTLPDGRTVTVVVAADQGKLPDVKKNLEEVANRAWLGTVTVTAETENLRGDIMKVVQFANGQRGTIQTFANGAPAIATINGVKYQIDATTGTLKILGDPAPGEANLNGFKLKVDATTGQITLDANAAPGQAKVMALKSTVDGTTGTVTINANGAPAEVVLNGTKYKVDATTGIMTIDGNPAPGEADRTGLKASIDQTNGTITILGRDGGVAALKATLSQPSSSTHTIYVRQVSVGASFTGSASGTVGAGGGVVGFSAGGIAGKPTRFARGGVIRGYQPGRDTVPALLSRGEGVLVPELVRQLGARRILAANAEASGRKAGLNVGSLASVMDGVIPTTRGGAQTVATIRPNVTSLTTSVRGGSGGSGTGALLDGLNQLGATLRDELRDASDMAHGDAAMNIRNVRALAEAIVVAMRADSGAVAASARRTAAVGMHG